ncbi:MAG: hypothetical protein UH963_12625 [Agathobacter sp.]|nr:hypothetical protein [Agathobacter sp.]
MSEEENTPVEKKAKKKVKKEIPKSKKLLAFAVAIDMVILCVLGGFVIYSYSKIVELTNQLSYVSDTANVILTDVGNMRTGIESTLEEEASLIEDWNITVSDVDFDNKTYTVDIVVVPKAYKDTTKLVIYFGTKKYPLTLDGYQYVGNATLPLSKSYDGNVTVLFANGSKKNTEVLSSYEGIQPKFTSVLSGTMSKMPEYEDGKLIIKSDVNYGISEENVYGFTSFEYIIEVDGKKIDSLNLKKEVMNDGKKASDKKDNEHSVDNELTTESTEYDSDINPLYTVLGVSDINKKYDVDEDSDVRIYIEAKTQEGYDFQYDLFNGTTNTSTEDEDAEGFVDSLDYFESNACVYDTKGGKLSLEEKN